MEILELNIMINLILNYLFKFFYNTKYLIPIFPILLLKYNDNDKFNYKLFNLINLYKPNPKYLIPISLILFLKYNSKYNLK